MKAVPNMIPVMIAVVALATATPPHGYTEIKRLDLSRAFHTKTPWTMMVYQPTGPDAETGDKPVQVCLTGGHDDRTNCEKIEARGYVFQTFVSAAVEPLSTSARVNGVVVRAAFSGGAHTLTRTAIWTYNGSGLADGFLQTSAFDLSDLGEEQRFASSPLDGFYIRADSVDTYAGETYWSDHRFSISVYRLDPSYGGSGYLQVLQYVSASRYPAERNDAHYVVERELPRARLSPHDLPGRTAVVTEERSADGRTSLADRVREFVWREELEPVLSRSADAVAVVRAGDVHQRMHLKTRLPAVCAALRWTPRS